MHECGFLFSEKFLHFRNYHHYTSTPLNSSENTYWMVSEKHPIQKLTLTVMTHSENCKNQLMDNDLCFALTLGLSTIYIMFQPLALSPGSWVKLRSLPYDERLCNLCQRQDLEDEYHLVLICPVYIELKKQFIKR